MHAESVRLDRRLGGEDRADHGRRLVPAGHARHRHRRQRREGDAARQGSADGADRHARAEGARRRETASRSCASRLFDKVNALGIGAQGLGGLTTVLDVKILDYPTHAASLPVAMIPNCAATRHAHFTLDGSGAAKLARPDLARLARRALDAVAEVAPRRPRRADPRRGRHLEARRAAAAQRASMLTGRDAAHKRIADMLASGETLPVDFPNRVDLLRRPGRSGARRSGRSGRADDRDAHGQVHRDDARQDRADRDGRQGRARPVAIEAIRRSTRPPT